MHLQCSQMLQERRRRQLPQLVEGYWARPRNQFAVYATGIIALGVHELGAKPHPLLVFCK